MEHVLFLMRGQILSLPSLQKGIAAIGAETIKQMCDPDRYLQGACLSGVVVMPPGIYSVRKNYFDFSGAVEE
ncbi:hypothetical protein DAH32_08670 [Escherichia coli]|nr:hypothetical protein DAH32_08670 [Escherichia coli]